jgi:hypothetical protein
MRSIFDFKHINTALSVPNSDVTIDVYTDAGYLYVRVFNGDTLVNHLDISSPELIDIELITNQLKGECNE